MMNFTTKLSSFNFFSNFSFNFGPFFIALAASLWTTDAFLRGNLRFDFSAVQVVFLEHFLIILIISPFFVASIPKLLTLRKNELASLLVIGGGGSAFATVLLTLGFFQGFDYIPLVVLLQQTQPIIAIGLARIILKEKLPKYYLLFAVAAIVGVYMIMFPYLTGFTGDFGNLISSLSRFGDINGLIAGLCGLGAAFLWGCSTVFGRYILSHSDKEVTFQEMTIFRFYTGFLCLFIFLVIGVLAGFEAGINVFQLFKSNNFPILLYIAVIIGLVSLILYYFGLKRTKASVATLFELAFPLWLFFLIPILNLSQPSIIQYIGAIVLIISSTTISFITKENDNKTENE